MYLKKCKRRQDMDIALDKKYTYADYLTWDDDVRRELFDGIISLMPGVNYKHQDTSINLLREFLVFLKGKQCKVYHPPSDVRLSPDNGDSTVVQPDIFVVCDLSKLDGQSCVGPPELVIEILSPSSEKRDLVKKYKLYRKAGVPEYWVVDPEEKEIYVYLLNNGYYDITEYGINDTIPVKTLEGFELKLTDVFMGV